MSDLMRETFRDPPSEYGVMPFWFWNDDLDEREIVRQIGEFHAKGFGGFIPHARIGLSRRIAYLGDEWFRLIRIATDEAARLGMKVVLYDEGSYPSGSAAGLVAKEDPSYLSRCLIALHHTVEGPKRGFWRPNPGRAMGDRLECVVLGRETAPDTLDPASLTILEPGARDVVGYDVPDGTWRLVAVWDVQSGGTIRGVHDEEDDGHALAPAAGDLLNPDAVAAFIRLTHDQYYEHLRDHFGTTVVAMFTDEPNVFGRGARRGPEPKPFTPGLLDDVARGWTGDVRQWLPALWLDCGPRTEGFRRACEGAAGDRLERVFYGAQSRWCEEHGIALTGHPSASNEMRVLGLFQWPGQDMVWRYVEPGKPTALEGAHSAAAKAASSAAAIAGRSRNSMETFGAYGWHLTLDEAKWLLDWHLVRGNDLYFLHAVFYSIRGRRAFESEPDIGVHNVWWPHFGILADYARRMTWLLVHGRPVCRVAILTDPDNMATTAASVLLRNQVGFHYVDADALQRADVADGIASVGDASFHAVVCDPADTAIDDALRHKLHDGGVLVLNEELGENLAGVLAEAVGRDVEWTGNSGDSLRVLTLELGDRAAFYLVNEGEEPLEGAIALPALGALERWDPLTGEVREWPADATDGELRTRLRLERRQGLVLVVDPPSPQSGSAEPERDIPGEVVTEVDAVWTARTSDGAVVDAPCPGDWSRAPGWEAYTGVLQFTAHVSLDEKQAREVSFLDLGEVGDIAEVTVNGQPVGVRAWAPYTVCIGPSIRRGGNEISVRITNSMANEFDGRQLPSGVLGPITLREARDD